MSENGENFSITESKEFGNFVSALGHYKWEDITIQPFTGSTGKLEELAIRKILDLIVNSINSESNIFIYCTWPKNTSDTLSNFNYSGAWLSDFSETDSLIIENRKFFEYLERQLSDFSGNLQYIAMGEMIFKFDQEAQKGNIPGFKCAGELYVDAWHMNNVGRYIAGMTVFSTIYCIDPWEIPNFNGYLSSERWPTDRTLNTSQKVAINNMIAKELGY